MDNAPWFDDAGPVRRRARSGSRTSTAPAPTDLIYLRRRRRARSTSTSRATAGASRSARRRCRASTTVASVDAVDLLGNGTACLVWSSPLPGDARRPLRYVDLMGGQKPHLLTSASQQPRRRDARRVRAVDAVLPCGTRRAGTAVDHPAAVPRARRRAGRDVSTGSAATASSPATPTTTATTTASSASSAASAWSSSGTPRSSRDAAQVDGGNSASAATTTTRPRTSPPGADEDLVPHRALHRTRERVTSSRGEYYRDPRPARDAAASTGPAGTPGAAAARHRAAHGR